MAVLWVAMSGGVDSSVAAARLVAAGHEVTGVTMQLLPEGEEDGRCCSSDAVRSAKRVCDRLGIGHYTLNMRDVFARCVVDAFVTEYASGRTPNPCIECNDRVKFAELLARARTAGADALATGHYARIERDRDGVPWLARGRDGSKDQSYFLYRLTREQLEHVWFPVGDSTKAQIRAEAADLGLPSATRPESQEICFVPEDAGAFVIEHCPAAGHPGPIVDEHGEVLGAHRGLARYTIGQRKGLGLPGGPWYVTAIDADTNRVTVAPRSPADVKTIELTRTVWRPVALTSVDAVVRYRAEQVPARVTRPRDGVIELELVHPVSGVAPGQAVVCYSGKRVVGGGVAESTS